MAPKLLIYLSDRALASRVYLLAERHFLRERDLKVLWDVATEDEFRAATLGGLGPFTVLAVDRDSYAKSRALIQSHVWGNPSCQVLELNTDEGKALGADGEPVEERSFDDEWQLLAFVERYLWPH